jgi:hypothetical protein
VCRTCMASRVAFLVGWLASHIFFLGRRVDQGGIHARGYGITCNHSEGTDRHDACMSLVSEPYFRPTAIATSSLVLEPWSGPTTLATHAVVRTLLPPRST